MHNSINLHVWTPTQILLNIWRSIRLNVYPNIGEVNVFIGPLRLLKNCGSDGGCFIDNVNRTYFERKQNTFISLCKFNDKLKFHWLQFVKHDLTLTPFYMWHVVYKTSFDWRYKRMRLWNCMHYELECYAFVEHWFTPPKLILQICI